MRVITAVQQPILEKLFCVDKELRCTPNQCIMWTSILHTNGNLETAIIRPQHRLVM